MGNTAGFTIARSALLIDALSTISASGDEDAMLSKLAAALRWLIGFTRLDFAKTTDDGQRCRVRTLFGAHSGPGEPWEESLSPTSGPAGAFLASGRSWLASDDTRYTPPRTILAISLAADERTYGALIFETAEPAGFHAKDIEAARIVGQHLGFALAGSATTLRLQVEVERRTALESELRHAAASAEAANRTKDDLSRWCPTSFVRRSTRLSGGGRPAVRPVAGRPDDQASRITRTQRPAADTPGR